jgi:hypothetical protein
LICEKEDKSNLRSQTVHWSDYAPNHVCHQINNCTKKGRKITGLAFREDQWYLSGEKYDGSGGYCWGNVSDKTPNAAVAIGSFDYYYNEHGYAICHKNGGFNSNHLPSNVLDVMHKAKHIDSIWISKEGDQYFILDGASWTWSISNKHVQKELKCSRDGVIKQIAMFDDGSWLVFREKSFATSVGVPSDLTALIQKHYDDQEKISKSQQKRVNAYRNAMVSLV